MDWIATGTLLQAFRFGNMPLDEKFGNLNSLLGWGHARVIENLLEKRPDCPRALSDKFADSRVVEKALLQHGQRIRRLRG